MRPGCSAAGDLYTLQAKAAPPPAGAPPLLEALQLNKLDVNTPRVPDAARQFCIKLDPRAPRDGDSFEHSKLPSRRVASTGDVLGAENEHLGVNHESAAEVWRDVL